MKSLVPLFLFLALAGFQTALSASLETKEKEDAVVEEVAKVPVAELTELQKTDQIEFEAAQKNEEHTEDSRYLEAVHVETVVEQVAAGDDSKEGDDKSVTSHEESSSESTEDTDGMRQRREHHETETEKITNFATDERNATPVGIGDLVE
ncbi:uncharacterized protein LOC115542887 isoform X2 [Gadus morhua]|uniref:uncharacterized protein LOC115542887 isoform X2 n=1 Tax=Gadus morhua TaxID=8049 RepID=UPI0011B41224|nr:uncharacterized protein LOC115542887 isoform X2 [Gadus morhua]